MEKIDQKKIALITGASHGIGFELTRKMLGEGWQVIAMNRSDFPKDDLEIQESINKNLLRVYKADLADFNSLKQGIEQIKEKENKIDVLFNNAGGSFPELIYSKQGRELHYELHTVVPYIIFRELKGLLLKGELKTVINTSSNALKYVKHFTPGTLGNPKIFKKLFGPYANSKLALSLWTKEIAMKISSDDIKIRSADPGSNNTTRKGKISGIPFYIKPLRKFFFSHPSKGALLLYEAALSESTKDLSGVFLVKNKITDLKFGEQGPNVLENVDFIYNNDFKTKA